MAIIEQATGNNSVGITGIASEGESTIGVKGVGDSVGVQGIGKTWNGVEGFTENKDRYGVYGNNTAGGTGVAGESIGFGVVGKGGTGVVGESENWVGVRGTTNSTQGGSGIWGEHLAGGTAIFARSDTGLAIHGKGGRLAGLFEGDVEVTGDIRLTNADCAEEFSIAGHEAVQPGTVMILCNEEGSVQPSQRAYDKRVAGVISGAGEYRPGIVLDKQESRPNRMPIALLGKVYCKVDASYAPIEVGDLLTTAPTPGHAMKADDPRRAFGAVIGKALRSLPEGQGLIPILIALQ